MGERSGLETQTNVGHTMLRPACGQILDSKFRRSFACCTLLILIINHRLSTARSGAGGVYDPQLGFVIIGGRSSEALFTAERTYDGISFSSFPIFPGGLHPYYGHCLVSLKNGGNLLAASRSSTFKFNGSTNTWTTLASMPASPEGIINSSYNPDH